MLSVENVTVKKKKTEILSDINFSIHPGEIVGLVGINGAGKSTMIKAIMDMSEFKGNICWKSKDIRSSREIAFREISACTEDINPYLYMTGEQNMRWAKMSRSISQENFNKYCSWLGKTVNISKRVKNYSTGMKNKLLLSMCFMCCPELIILDETLNGLDAETHIAVRDIIQEMAVTQHTSFLIASHQLNELDKIADRFLFLDCGKIIKDVKKGTESLEESYLKLCAAKKGAGK